jgi:hypothetical protein
MSHGIQRNNSVLFIKNKKGSSTPPGLLSALSVRVPPLTINKAFVKVNTV